MDKQLTAGTNTFTVEGKKFSISAGTNWKSVKAIDLGGGNVVALNGTYSGNTVVSSITNCTLSVTNLTNKFAGCTALKDFSVTGSTSYSYTVDGMFSGCTSLSAFTFPNITNATKGAGMFYNCWKLKSFDYAMPNLTGSIDGMFYFASSMTKCAIGNLTGVTSAVSGFYGTRALTAFSSTMNALKNGDQMFCTSSISACSLGSLSSLTNGSSMFYNAYNLTSFSANPTALTNADSMFEFLATSSDKLATVILGTLSELTNANRMFEGRTALTALHSAHLTMPNIVTGDYIFYGCSSLSYMSQVVWNSLKTSKNVFCGCSSLTGFGSVLQMNSCTDASEMFARCSSFTASTLLTSYPALTCGTRMFSACTSLVSMPTIQTPALVDGQEMYRDCTALTSISYTTWDSLTGASRMFVGCTSLVSAPQGISMVKIKDMYAFMSGCSSFSGSVRGDDNQTVTPFSSSTVVSDMRYAFYGCSAITTIHGFNVSALTNSSALKYTFRGCTSLETLVLMGLNEGVYLDLRDCPNLGDWGLNEMRKASISSSTANKTIVFNKALSANTYAKAFSGYGFNVSFV